MTASNTLSSETVQQVLSQLHQQAKKDWRHFIGLAPRAAVGLLQGKSILAAVTPKMMKHACISIAPETGRFLYLTARAAQAQQIVEFGTSFGISTIYLAAAINDNGGGTLIGTELEESKQKIAVANLKKAGLDNLTDIRPGDALETLKKVPDQIDMVFLDGWKDLYIPVIKLLKPRLRPGAVVIAEDVLTFKRICKPYRDYMQSGKNGFVSMTLNFASGIEYSCFQGEKSSRRIDQ